MTEKKERLLWHEVATTIFEQDEQTGQWVRYNQWTYIYTDASVEVVKRRVDAPR